IRADLDPKQYRRFRREAQILADLKHPNLVFLYEAGRMADGRPYLAMEYVEGENLRDWLQSRGSMPLAMIVEVMKQACAGVDAAHTAGVIHRDIKPGNIVLSESGGKLSVKVLDFGIAARRDSDSSEISGAHDVIGTLPYMSPEQLQARKGDELTAASDVYSLGLTVYELLTGRRAITGNSPAEIISKHLLETPVPPSQIRQDLEIVDRVMMMALAKEPEARYQSASEFAAALETAIFKTKPPPIPQPHPPLPPSPKPDWKKYAGMTAAAAAIVAGLLATYLVRMNAQNAPPGSAQIQPRITPAPVQAVEGKRLKIQLDVKAPSGLRYDKCAFALYRTEVKTIPEKTGPDNAHVIMIGIGSASAPKEVNDESVTPGEYLVKFACEGFKTFSGKVRVAEDPKDEGYATVAVPLERR
ncbi:MAG: serine/threonine-protein kinase, partial [Blastocatellia bacterium]